MTAGGARCAHGESPRSALPAAAPRDAAWAERAAADAALGRTAPARRAVASDDLFQGLRELVILHRNEEYRLRITRAGKLILTT
jgi:hemin uptake protein HemP